MVGKADSVWYPSLTLYRQKTLKDWDSVALDLKEDLKKNLIRNEPEIKTHQYSLTHKARKGISFTHFYFFV